MESLSEIKEKVKKYGVSGAGQASNPYRTNNTSEKDEDNGYIGSSQYQEIKNRVKNGELSFDIDQDYLDSYISDANNFINSAQTDFESMGWSTALSTYNSKRDAYYSDLYQRGSYIKTWLTANKSRLDEETYKSLSDAVSSINSSISSVVDTFGSASAFYGQWDTEEAYNKWYEGEKEKQSILNSEDFEHYSQLGANIKNPSPSEAEPYVVIAGKGIGGKKVGNVVTYSRDNAEALGFGEANGGGSYAGGKFVYTFMTDDEVSVYNYYLGKGEIEKANNYLASLENTLIQRHGGQIAENLEGHKLAEVVFGFASGLEQFAYGVGNLDNYIKGTEADPLSATQYASGAVREDMNGLWGVAYDLANTTGNMLPSILVGTVTGGLGGAITLGTSAVGNGYAEMRRLGYDEWQARGYGFLVGASEAALQYALGGISALGGKVSNHAVTKFVSSLDNALARTAIKLGGNMASEGLEEAIQSVVEPAFKAWMTGEAYEAPELEEVLYSALLGALSAGALEGVPTIAGTAIDSYRANKVYGAEPQALVTEALEIDPENTHAQRMQTKLDNGKNVSGYQLNRLVEANEQTLHKQDIAKMTTATEARLTELGETGDISNLAKAIVKQASGERLSLSEKNLLNKSKHGVRVANEISPSNIESGEYTSKWAENLGTERINTEAYNKGLYDLASEQAGVAVAEEESPVTENPTEKEIATETKFEVSTDGRTKIGDTEVSIKEIASVKNGEAILRLEDGSTVNASDVEYGSSEEGLLYESVAHMNLNAATANAFVKGYDPSMSVEEYALGFREAYRYGEYGFPVQEMSTKGFSAKLTESQKSLAYNLGKTDAKYKIDKKSEKIASIGEKNTENIASKGKIKGKLHNTIKPSTERQRASLKALGTLAEALGIDIYTFESKEVNGKRQGANGWFDPKDGSIHIDIHAGINGEGTMLFTAAHELTHFIREWSPAKFKVFADFLLEQYGKKGVSVDALVRAQIAKAKNNGRDISYDTAYEEVIADSCEAMLADGDAIAKIAELKAKDQTLWEKIKEFITKLVERIKSVYEGMTPDSVEGRYVAEMLDSAEKLKALWTEALVEASDNYTSAEKTLFDSGISVDSKTESASLMSVRDLLNSEQQQKVAKTLAERFDVTEEEAKGWISAETSLASLILNPKYSQYLDYVADPNEEAVKSNSDYPQGTVDFSNICKKRRDFTEVMNRVLRNFPNHVFEAADLAKIRTIMSEEGMEVACGICYVEDRRQLDSIVAQDFIDSLALYRKGSKTRPDGKAFNANQLKALKLIDGDSYTPSIYELVSLEGRNSLKAKNPAMEEAWVKFNNARGMQSVRLLLNDAEYKRQILDYKPSVVKRKNDLGGLRIYSFSDMEMFHLIDIIQVITDSATVGLSLQGYTKVNEYAKAVKDTGEKLNRSLIPKGDLGYHMENGRIVLDYDTVEGIDVNHPDFFDNIDNPNVGNIVIGINATQIKAAMTSKFIDQIIPFHTGQSNEVLGEKGIATWQNYKDFQSERDLSTGKKSSHQINIYTEVIQAAEAEGKPIKNKVDFVNKFLEVCKENNLEPRFSEFLNVDENGDYIYTEGYHKFLVDFKTFDQNTGEYLPQMPVKPIFENKYITQLLKDYVKTQKKKDADFSKAIPKVLDRITNEIVNTKNNDIRYSDRYSYENLTSKPDMKVTEVDDSVKHNRADIVVYALKNAESVGHTNQNGNAVVHVEDIDTDVIVPKRSLVHGLDRRINTQAPVLIKIGEVLKNSIRINELNPRADEIKNSYVLVGAARNQDGHLYIASFVVNKYSNEVTEIDVLYSANAKKESAALLPKITDKSATPTDSVISIAQLLDYVNRYFPDILSESVLRHYGYDSRPEGKIGESALYSDRYTDSVSNRSLLANALESVAQNDIERDKLKEYKGKIALIESEQAKLSEIRTKIKELSFAKGKRDTEAIRNLQFEENQTANRINTYDKQLLNLESTTALKGVLEREKKMAYKRAEQRGKDALAAYRERATKTQRELMTRYQESRKKGVENRNKTAMRHKIKDVVSELNQYLLKGTKEKHIPIELQKAVAEALDSVNMDTVGAEERIAKKQAEMRVAKSLEEMQKLSKEIEHIQEMGGNMNAKLSRLKTAYDSIIKSDDPLIANSHDEVISNTIDKVIEVVGNTPLRDMSLYQLEAVYDMYKMVLTSVRNANKAFKAAKSEEISVIANRVMEEIDKLGKKKLYTTKASQFISKFDWNNLKPVYAFDRIGSNTFTEVFNNVRAGEDSWAVDITEAKEFSKEQRKKFKYDSWDFKKRYGFTSSSGMHFELSLDQIMSLYAYSKREQARDHLKKGGIVFDETTEVTVKNKLGIPVKFNPTQATAYNLSDETLADIISKLTTEQKAFVDAMQDYLSTTMGDKGNEVSLALYGVKLYKEKHYFPLKSASQFMAKAKEQQKGEVKIKNSGFSKETTPKASNPVVLTPFMDVWADHVNEMSMYHSFVLPLEDFYRVYNYKTPTSDTMATESVQMFLQNAFGKEATQYVDQLLKDLNGGARVDPTAGIINKLTGLFKKSAVFASLSVVVQQPSAIARATALVDTKYFVGKPSKTKHKETWAEVKKYAPVATIKEMGYFDTGMGQSTVEWIKDKNTWKDKVDDVASKAPALADELAWCAIWKAIKRETLHTHKDLSPNSEEFLKAVGERFTEVITKTQVYDSVLARSANMRSKDTGMKMATAFMGEPTTSINMLENALTQGKRGNKRYARKAVGSVVASMILNSILVSIVYAGRDDDEEKTYAEKYIGTLTEELIDSINPLTLIPFVKDIVSIVQGYDVERSDMAVITDLVNAWNNLEKDNRSAYRKVEDFAGAIASLFGLPVKNIMRDARGMYNTVNSFIKGEQTTGAGIKNSIVEAVTGDEKSNGQQLYEAILSGDTAQIQRVKGRFKDQKAIDSAIRTALRDNDTRIQEAAEARYNGDIAEYMRIAKEIIAEGNFSQDNIVSAINSAITALKKEEGTSDSTTSSNKVTSIYKVDDYYAAIVGRDQATAYVVKEDLIKTDVANGKDREEAEADFNSKFASHLRDLYEKGEITSYEAQNMLVNYGGKSDEDASSKIQYWDFKKKYPDYDLSEEAVKKYYNDVEPSGIGVDVYYDYSKQRAKCKGVDANGDGKTDSGSVKREVMQVINSLPITSYQKDVLYYLNGWSASTLWEAPWH